MEEARFERANYIRLDLQSSAFDRSATPPYSQVSLPNIFFSYVREMPNNIPTLISLRSAQRTIMGPRSERNEKWAKPILTGVIATFMRFRLIVFKLRLSDGSFAQISLDA